MSVQSLLKNRFNVFSRRRGQSAKSAQGRLHGRTDRRLAIEPLEVRQLMAVTGVDLQVTSVNTDVWQSALVSDTHNWTATVKNGGTSTQTSDFDVTWFLSTDTTYSSNDVKVGSVRITDDVAPGRSLPVSANLKVPGLTGGQYYVIANVTTYQLDADTSNNRKSMTDSDWYGNISSDSNEGWLGNDGKLTATNLGAVGWNFSTSKAGTIHKMSDVDYYYFTISYNGVAEVRIDNFKNNEGDLYLRLLDKDGRPVQPDRDTSSDSEVISLTGRAGSFYAVVGSANRDVSKGYKLTVVGPKASSSLTTAAFSYAVSSNAKGEPAPNDSLSSTTIAQKPSRSDGVELTPQTGVGANLTNAAVSNAKSAGEIVVSTPQNRTKLAGERAALDATLQTTLDWQLGTLDRAISDILGRA